MSTSAIEGEHLNRDSVKASIRKQLGLVTADDKKRNEASKIYGDSVYEEAVR